MDSYLKLIEQIGEGAFSKLYKAYDFRLNRHVALKIEKNNKKQILKNEYEIYNSLQNSSQPLPCIPKIYSYIPNINKEKEENAILNCLEMELLGKNLLLFKKSFNYYNNILAYDIILQCLKCIQKIHNHGFVHRDIKPSNFCLHKEDEEKIISNYQNNIYFKHEINVYLIDFGLVQKIKNKNNTNLNIEEENKNICGGSCNGFVGTLTYASMSAHKKEELTKKDDLWSFFFMLLELLNENLPWRNFSFEQEKTIIEIKQKCIDDPEKYLFLTNTKNNKEILNIFNYIKHLNFETEPDYEFIFNQLIIAKNKEIQKIYKKYEINNQIMNLQKNLLVKTPNRNLDNANLNNQIVNQNQNLNLNDDKINININVTKPFNDNKLSQQDYMIYKLSRTSHKSIPSLNSTNYSSSLYYKTNYINCLSGNNNENFYQSVLKLNSNSKNNYSNFNETNDLNSNKKYNQHYHINNTVNIHQYKIQNKEENYNYEQKQNQDNNNNNKTETIIKNNNCNKNNSQEKKQIKQYENDKELIEFLSGYCGNDSSSVSQKKKNTNKRDKKNKKTNIRKMNIHNKRKNLKFSIIKND